MYQNNVIYNSVDSPGALHLLAGLIYVGCPNRRPRYSTVVFHPDCPVANVSDVYSADDVYVKEKEKKQVIIVSLNIWLALKYNGYNVW